MLHVFGRNVTAVALGVVLGRSWLMYKQLLSAARAMEKSVSETAQHSSCVVFVISLLLPNRRWSAVIMVPAKAASSSQSTDALSHSASPEVSASDINRVREAVAKLPKYSATGESAVDKDLSSKHKLLCTMVIAALTQPEYVLPMHEAYLTVLNAKEKGWQRSAILANQITEKQSCPMARPEQTHSEFVKAKGGPHVQECSSHCVGGAKANPCQTRGRHSLSTPQQQADRIQKEVMTQQQQSQKKTDRSTAVAMEARERPREWRVPVGDCGPVSPGDWLQILDFQPPLAFDPYSRSILMFEVSLGWILMIITTCTSYLEISVKPGDWLRVANVTFDGNGSPSIFQLVSMSEDREHQFQAQFVRATVAEPP